MLNTIIKVKNNLVEIIYNIVVDELLKEIKGGVTEDFEALRTYAEKLSAFNLPDLFGGAINKITEAANRLEEYNNYK